jgi:hypothetical protein
MGGFVFAEPNRYLNGLRKTANPQEGISPHEHL